MKREEGKFPLNQISPELVNVYNKMQLLPTMYICKGKSVFLSEGLYKDQGDPFERAEYFSINSDMVLVDLDKENGLGNNSALIKMITSKYKCYLEGGITSIESANEFLSSNVKRIVLNPKDELIDQIPPNRIILKVEIDSEINVSNAENTTSESPIHLFDFLKKISNKINFISIHFKEDKRIDKASMMTIASKLRQYLDTNEIKIRTAICSSFDSVKEIKELIEMRIIPQFNSEFWMKGISFGDIFSGLINETKVNAFSKADPHNDYPLLIPVVVIKAEDNLPLGIVYTTKEGIKRSVDEKKCYFFYKELNQLILPSRDSANSHSNIAQLHQVSFGCDRSHLLFAVSGGYFCNRDNYSCFNWHKAFNGGMKDLEKIILMSVKYGKENSYTKKIASNKNLVLSKVIEEANEVWCASSSSLGNLKYEISDFVYFLTIFCVSCGIDLNLIYAELLRRHFSLTPQILPKPMQFSQLKLGMCISKYHQQHLFDFIRLNGLAIVKEGKRIKAEFTSDTLIAIKAFIIKPKDVYRFIEHNLMDAVICYQDILDNYPCSYSHIEFPNKSDESMSTFTISKICVIANKEFNIEDFKKNPLKKVVIFSEYNYLTTKWVDQMNLTAKIVVVHGANEGHLVNRLCDLIVCVVSTGETVRANNLVILNTIYESSIGLHVKKGLETEIQKLIDTSRK